MADKAPGRDALLAPDVEDELHGEREQWERERVRLEELLFRSHKASVYGSLARGIIHEFNNILGIIMAYTEMGLKRVPKEDRLYKDMEKILAVIRRAKELVKQIPSMAGGAGENVRPMEIALLVKGAAKWLEADMPSSVTLRTEIRPGCGPSLIDAAEVHQVVMHTAHVLCRTLEQSGGLLRVGVDSVTLPRDPATPAPDLPPGKYIALWFQAEDELKGEGASGPDAEYGAFSLEEEVAQRFGGAFFLEKTDPGRSRRTLFFPELPLPEEDREPWTGLPGGRERLLFVDDEHELVLVWTEMLSHLGYKVKGALSGRQALEIFKENPVAVDLVLTDRTMPIMPGERLTREIKKVRPEVPVLMLTGHAGVMTPEMLREKGLEGCLHKPLSAREVALTIREVLDKTPGPGAGKA